MFRPFSPASRARGGDKGMINSDLPEVFRHQAQALGGHLSCSDRHMVLPVEASGRPGMGSCCER